MIIVYNIIHITKASWKPHPQQRVCIQTHFYII